MYLSGKDNPIWPAQDFRSWPHEKSPLFGHYNKSFIDQQACSLKMVRFFFLVHCCIFINLINLANIQPSYI